jgi:hypothetical protein
MTEEDFQAQVVQLAGLLGWRHMHVRRSIGKGRRWTTATNVTGWPDLTLWSARHNRLIFVELKSEHGRVSDDQAEVLASLRAAGCEVHVWRPSDLDTAQQILSARTVEVS